jgi:hypothetical protein
MTYAEWARQYPQAADALAGVIVAAEGTPTGGDGKSEAWSQQRARLDIAKYSAGGVHAMSWRNNVGATPAKCKHCGEKSQPVRFGLANDSPKMNEKIKSSDLILAIPRIIKPQDVGSLIAQFGSVEVKRPGWKFTGKGREVGQATWLALVARLGGYAKFTTGEVEL